MKLQVEVAKRFYSATTKPHIVARMAEEVAAPAPAPATVAKKTSQKDVLDSSKTPGIQAVDTAFFTVGVVESCWTKLTAAPRQAGLSMSAVARIRVAAHFRDNGALQGLDGYSHLWVLWLFNKNVTPQKPADTTAAGTAAAVPNFRTKIRAPKLYLGDDGGTTASSPPKIGVFATRFSECLLFTNSKFCFSNENAKEKASRWYIAATSFMNIISSFRLSYAMFCTTCESL